MFIKFIGNDIYYYSLYGLHTLLSHTLPCILLVFFTWKLISAIRIADERYAKLIGSRFIYLNLNLFIYKKKFFLELNV